MASSSSDLTLDDHHHLTAVAAASGQATQKLQEFLSRLEEERLKIDAFKRELPLCMQLLNHAMEAYRQQLEAYQMGSQHGAAAAAAARAPLVLEEFIPVKNIGIDVVAADKAAAAAAGGNSVSSEKASWMLALAPAEKAADAITIAAGEVDKKPYAHDNGVVARSREAQNGGKPPSTPPDGQAVPPPPQPHRKARRCWSPELHRRFVNALQILGGAQVATPKQIRELMKVDGLTNDEVKSHLQKYRLHTRRPMPSPAPPTAATPQLVVLGGIWVPPEYATQAAGPAIYGAHPATQPHYTAAVAAQEYYHHHHHHLQHHPAAAALVHHRAVAPPPPLPPQQQLAPPYSAKSSASARLGSPDSDGRGSGGGGGAAASGAGRDMSESIEEEGEGEEREDDDDDDEMAATNNAHAVDGDDDDDEINTTTTTSAGAINY
ncbi:hypothetical protein OsI_00620 [Oryza sativa Indica Group]|uniref:HTH myb-type domain-containing protein n=1 Tax=Oryza sativa subsp. indica TaxID=39946 RepID=A2WLA8_ORYSI|nr:hypothetical protein OsI_00620 [Oryza sativa Indica Group]